MEKLKKEKNEEKTSDQEIDNKIIDNTSCDSDDDFKPNVKFKNEISDNCSDATYLAKKMLSQEELPEKDSIKLFNLSVQLEHTVPPQHKIETRAGSHIPSKEIIEQFEKIVPLKKGTYSVEEDEIIVRNWKRFCTLHNWDEINQKPFLQLRTGTATYIRHISQRRKFVQFLANGLPNRTLYSVYHRFRNLYKDNVQTRYKPDEDQMIIDHLENNPSLDESRKYVDLAKVLRRTRHSIWRRYRILKKKKKLKKA
ncbi:uncharacterized protein LOC116844941 isoform X2 [Odontomachus brunneus]|uniref:uncharacterized protein LOC116844941 isoform X1 n=1 Tax=Odontomachus brunneus TaxID=486640 RepID=UPI0013F1C75A|nr:uncharacterized protein LOC116844941 isoform X1 [Odontomachus brunneus]XP_032673025.1 uncharacterized protein LOC116844941 isoform X2 [Odontomachus brunneus]